ncbi:hypothetical protein PLANPX_1049 [Lacipirellula parvula]|uniref:Uncharacterized protein n=1 Tax=Lacipirellula parvula TaxID=2650471 RepID=A0A5K7X6H0_9BACT|nr:hypothetical protein PLANPX_1049 [Lacipirellula parvula]
MTCDNLDIGGELLLAAGRPLRFDEQRRLHAVVARRDRAVSAKR